MVTNEHKKYVECYQHFLFCSKVLPYPMNIPLLRNIKISWDLITFHNSPNWFLLPLSFKLRSFIRPSRIMMFRNTGFRVYKH